MADNVLDELINRGIINRHEQNGREVLAITNEPELFKILSEQKCSIYIGFDPSAISLHVGNLLPIITLVHFQRYGHRPIIVVGGATGMIGDPSGRSTERSLLEEDRIRENKKGIRAQLEKFVSFEGENAALMVDNSDWIGKISYVDWLRDIGKYFSVNYMMTKESVRGRLQDREQGITYTEFSYMLLQAYDFYHLFTHHDCRIQGGGSDQWGNITAGVDYIRKMTGQEAFGLTYPLITTSSGEKFGKSEGNAVWLDPKMTSPYKFYQFWFNTDDRDVERFLKYFTFLGISEIEETIVAHGEKPEIRQAQKILAREVTRLVHGEDGLQKALKATSVLFGADIEDISDEELHDIFSEVPSTSIPRAELAGGIALVDLMVRVQICKSKGEARRLIKGGGVYVNNKRTGDIDQKLNANDMASRSALLLRSGKKHYYLIKFQ
jgi:tyrosyl-tRNA synthetase